jgi:hypothetical protein
MAPLLVPCSVPIIGFLSFGAGGPDNQIFARRGDSLL